MERREGREPLGLVPLGRSTVRALRPGEAPPDGEPRRYPNAAGYVRLRWKVGQREYVETYERGGDGELVRTVAPTAKRLDEAEVVRLYRSGRSTLEVAAEVGCTSSAVSRVLRRRGVQARPQPTVDDAEVARLYAEGLGADAIAHRLGVRSSTVNKALRRRGVTKRRSGRPLTSTPSYEAEFQRARPVVRRRSRGRCEASIDGVCTVRAVHVHHIKPRGRGGSNDLANLADLCSDCHHWVHANPAEANERGLLLHSWEGPPA